MNSNLESINFTRAEAKELLAEIASVAEAAYRRGVQQGGAFGLSRALAAEYRYYGCKGRYFYQCAVPLFKGTFSRKQKPKCVDRMEWRNWVKPDGPFRELHRIANST